MDRRLADAGRAGIGEEVLDAAFDLVAAVMGGIAQGMNQRYKDSRKAAQAEG